MIVLFLFIICVYDDELYFLFENLHYHLNDFVILIWYMADTLFLSYIFLVSWTLGYRTIERLTYLKGYNHQGLSLKYILGCDIQVYHSIIKALSIYLKQDFG